MGIDFLYLSLKIISKNSLINIYRCFYHGCLKCNNPKSFNTIKQISFQALNDRHKYRIEKIKNSKINNKKINLVEIWEHEWDLMCKEDEQVIDFLNSYQIIDPLHARDAFFGGKNKFFI